MKQIEENKRVFFGFKVVSPWNKTLPDGRKIAQPGRHLTLAFLGNINYPDLEKVLSNFPKPLMKVGLVGKFDRCLFLPTKRPNVVAWRVHWFDTEYDLGEYQKVVAEWLESAGLPIRLNPKGFLPHVTLARRPFKYDEWRNRFEVNPMYIKDIHLYESLEGLNYRPIWSFPLLAPFEQTNHLLIRGENLTQLFHHLLTAIAFKYPQILHRYETPMIIESLEEILPRIGEILKRSQKVDKIPPLKVTSLLDPTRDELGVWEWQVSYS